VGVGAQVCFHCRQPGHRLAACPVAAAASARPAGDGAAEETGTPAGAVCYKCGAADHTARRCTQRGTTGFAFATCFVCGARGHLAGQCPQNAHGLYPYGGGCKYCGSVKHYARDCRPTQTDGERLCQSNRE
jgi:zinc finger CCHC domain-containing protein 9